MSEPTQNCLSATASTGSNPPSSSSPPQIPDLEAMRQRWDKKLEEDFAEIKEILRRDRDAHAQQQSTNGTHTQ
ncbi:hypothetical protein TMatcc_002553 [Talaromyces marneffei ATCC 18224]|uniref:uncharacterized protein n=1 Tax=Talaromyces marneffei TaxID=37727 RepID=UPI0012AAB372|nr:uncharacterized protein EYB26_002333 [Talaromyces marneffei]KAE8555325.1 hypothetical protein EYB25_000020 [Talaromyces marneffei]QGA14677.1 hypothetical protein EYB26_002333 [Talaromyces marneffei]